MTHRHTPASQSAPPQRRPHALRDLATRVQLTPAVLLLGALTAATPPMTGCSEAGDMWGQIALPPLAEPIAQGEHPQLTPRAADDQADEAEDPTAADEASGTGGNPGTSVASTSQADTPSAGVASTDKSKAGSAGALKPQGAAAVAVSAADKARLAQAAKAKLRKATDAERRARAARVVPLKGVVVDPRSVHGRPPRADFPLLAVFARIRQIASVGEVRYLRPWLSQRTLDVVARQHGNSPVIPVAPRTLWQRISGKVVGVEYTGSRAIMTLQRGQITDKLTFYVEGGTWRLDLGADGRPTGPTPKKPAISLREATHGIPGRGPLVAVFQTTAGRFRCQLNDALAPETVTHFVGLARGKIGPVNAGGRVRRFYDGLRFHAVAAGKLIQSGDPGGMGVGGAGLTIRDEFDPKLRHDRAGVLALASAGPHTGSSQFYVTLAAAPRLDDHHAAFGQCRDLDIVRAISRSAPSTVTIEKLTIQRGF